MSHKLLFFIVLGILLVVVWKTYWKLQLMYNSSVLSFYTPDTFPMINKELVEDMVTRGKVHASNSKIIITSLLRDVEERIPEIKKKVERVGNMFQDYRVFIVENDSTDHTRELLLGWTAQNPKVTILGCGYNSSECSLPKSPKTNGHHVDRPRIEKMTRLRNIYLDEIKHQHSPDDGWDYVVMWDLDMLGSVYLDGIQHTMRVMQTNPDINVVCAYGIYRWGSLILFYDTYALLHPGEDFHIDMKTIHDIRKGWWEVKHSRGDSPFDVDSCFSGFAIYKTDALLSDDVFYDMSPEGNLECEHVRLNKKIKGRKVVNPSMINYVLLND